MKRVKIYLAGPQGNAWYFIGLASKLGKQLGESEDEIKAFRDKMMSGDYFQLLETFLEKYGHMVELD